MGLCNIITGFLWPQCRRGPISPRRCGDPGVRSAAGGCRGWRTTSSTSWHSCSSRWGHGKWRQIQIGRSHYYLRQGTSTSVTESGPLDRSREVAVLILLLGKFSYKLMSKERVVGVGKIYPLALGIIKVIWSSFMGLIASGLKRDFPLVE